jgi:hypothetical protein
LTYEATRDENQIKRKNPSEAVEPAYLPIYKDTAGSSHVEVPEE